MNLQDRSRVERLWARLKQGHAVAIRCEKTAAWMHDAFDLDVHQLEGGILRYLAETPDAQADWQGECFVFDNRIALDAQLNETETNAAQVYAGDPDEAWRLQRAQRLAGA